MRLQDSILKRFWNLRNVHLVVCGLLLSILLVGCEEPKTSPAGQKGAQPEDVSRPVH
jgi:hypothetical protein